jgi:Protein of unknown function (DUF3450)
MRGKPNSAVVLMSVIVGLLASKLAFGQVAAVIAAEERRIQQAQAAQDQVDGIVSTTRSRFDEYQGLLKEIDGLNVYNSLLQSQIDDQNRQLDELRQSIEQVTVIERQILPLMTRMIAGLEQFIELDVPFLLDERRERVASLKALLNRSDVTAAEQFRNVIEAWQIEVNDYGSASEIYTDELEVNDVMREVEFLKIGRVALIYLTPDGQHAGAWDQATRQWVELPTEYNDDIRLGIETVRTGSPALFTIPVAPPEEG